MSTFIFWGRWQYWLINKSGETGKYIKEGFLLNFSRSWSMPALSVPGAWRQAKALAPKPVLCSSFVAQKMFYLCCFWGCFMTILAWWRRLELCNMKAGSSHAFWGLWSSWIDSKKRELEMPGEECTVGALEIWGRWKYDSCGWGWGKKAMEQGTSLAEITWAR